MEFGGSPEARSTVRRTPTIEEYEKAVQGIELTKFAPPEKQMSTVAPDYSTGNVEFRLTK